MKIKEIICALERFAPLPLQDGYDHSGLQIGITEVEATGALLCLDVTEKVILEAIELGFNLIISHHPLLFKNYQSLTGKDYVERCVMLAIKHDLVIYAAHTNLDNCEQGVNHKIAQKLGLTRLKVLKPKEDALLKLVTFVPLSHETKVRNALFEAGAGKIGSYHQCSFNTEGVGTFFSTEGTTPYVGSIGVQHQEPEIRIETILPAFLKNSVIAALKKAHPYQEVAYDLYTLQNSWNQVGTGLIGELEAPEETHQFLLRVKKLFNVGCLIHSPICKQKVSKIAILGGAGSSFISQAINSQADLYITGEIRYHDFFLHEEQITLAAIGHYESEQYTHEILHSILQKEAPSLKIQHTKINTNPLNYL